MTDESLGSSIDNSPQPTGRNSTRIVISAERFAAVPRKRAWYIGLYVVAFLLWLYLLLGPMLAASNTEDTAEAPVETVVPEVVPSPPASKVDQLAFAVMLVLRFIFYVPFVSVLRTVGYPWPAILAFCGFVFFPIPGLLVVAYVDTRLAKIWASARQNTELDPTQDAV